VPKVTKVTRVSKVSKLPEVTSVLKVCHSPVITLCFVTPGTSNFIL
jgi:hypothetical protein